MADPKIVQEWLDEANEDYGFASANLGDRELYFRKVCFHFQQAAEKYLKAFIVARGLPLRKIHDLVALTKICQESDPFFREITEEAIFLTDFYVETRYPVHWPIEINREEAIKAKTAVEKIKSMVEEKLDKKAEVLTNEKDADTF